MSTLHKVALIDPVGIKAGMDHYNVLLLKGISHAGAEAYLFSNFNKTYPEFNNTQVFHNTGVPKWKAIVSNFFGHLTAFRQCKKRGVQKIIVHIFRAGIFDLVVFSIARIMGLKIYAIAHDIESLDTFTLPFVRNNVLHRLPEMRIVHNDFCKNELLKLEGNNPLRPVKVIPHVHFRHLFNDYQSDHALLDNLKSNKSIAEGLHPELWSQLQSSTPVLLFFGQIKKAKGLDVLLEAITQTKSEFKVLVAGKVRDENWQRYDDILTALNIRNKVLPVIRHISDRERDFLFATSKAIVLPYVHIYQSGVLLMAMSFPMTVVASDLLPNKFLVNHGHNGLLFKTENAASLAVEIDKVVNDQINTSALKANAFHDIDEHYNPDKIGRLFKEALFLN
jgi:glycosyltransferase involved in cell wall biosynthesis